MVERRLNVDVAGSVALFQSVMKSLEIKTKLYRRMLKGRGLEFDGYRTYAQDDDASVIDWKASMRTNKILAKQFIEERNLKIMLIVDVGEGMVFGSTPKLKCEYAAEVLAALSNLIISSKDKFGYLLFGEGIKEFIEPQLGKKHFIRFMNTLTDASIYGGQSSLENALDFALNYVDKSVASVIIVSDFLGMEETLKDKLASISNKFETMALIVRDPVDKSLPDVQGELVVEDPVSGERILIDPSLARGHYEKYAKEQDILVKNMFSNLGVDTLELTTDQPFVTTLATFLGERVKRLKGVSI